MAHSILEFQNRHQMFQDGDLLIVSHMLMEHIDQKYPDDNLSFVEAWRDGFRWFGPGCIELDLDECFAGMEGRSHLISALQQIRQNILDKGQIISADYLNSIINAKARAYFNSDQDAERILNAIDKFLELVG